MFYEVEYLSKAAGCSMDKGLIHHRNVERLFSTTTRTVLGTLASYPMGNWGSFLRGKKRGALR
jgi:hypothetical protein